MICSCPSEVCPFTTALHQLLKGGLPSPIELPVDFEDSEIRQFAIAILAEDRFDAVFMDIQMPEMDGFEATAGIRRAERGAGFHTPIFALTAHAMAGDSERCIQAGMDGYLSKLIRPDKLATLVEAVGKL